MPSDLELDSIEGMMPLSPFELACQAIQSLSDTSSTKIDPMNGIPEESLSISSSATATFSDIVHTDEQIHELFSVDDLPWEDLHYRSSFLPELDHFEDDFASIFTNEYAKEPQNPLRNPDSEFWKISLERFQLKFH